MADEPNEEPEGVIAYINRMRAERGPEPGPIYPDTPATNQDLTGVAWRLHERLDAIETRLKKAPATPSLVDIATVIGGQIGLLRDTIIGATVWITFLMFVFWIWK